MVKYDRCKDRGTAEPALLYRSGKMPRCYDCQHYFNLTVKPTGGGVRFTRQEFLAWRREGPDRRRCVYCGIDGDELYRLGVLNVRTKERFEAIGVDRIDNSQPYVLANIAPCCALCNGIKSGILTHPEMLRVGEVLSSIWRARLASSAAPAEERARASEVL